MKNFRNALYIVVALLPLTTLAQEPFSLDQLSKTPYVWDRSSLQFGFSGTLEQAVKDHADGRVILRLMRHRARMLQAQPLAGSVGEQPFGIEAVTTYPIGGKTTQLVKDRKVDWSVSLGAGTVQASQYPAIYTASMTNADCVNDYVAFGLNVPGVTGGQANLVGVNQLYSGSNPTGICGTAPHVNWAYNGSTAGGKILLSPVIGYYDWSVLKGTKIAYVESTGHSSIFHVLTWKAGEGTSALTAAKPVTVGSCTTTSSCLTSLTVSSTSSASFGYPMVDWQSDKAWIGTDDGTIYQLSCTYTCALNTNPTIQWSYKLPVKGTGGAPPVPTAVGYDLNKHYVQVSDTLGEMWVLNVAGATPVLLAGPYMVGGGGCTTTNPPGRTGTANPCTANGGSYALGGYIEDQSVFKYYMWTGNDGVAGASADLVQSNDDLTDIIRIPIGVGSVGNTTTNVDIAFPDFDHAWWSNSTSSHMYICGTGTSDTTPFLYTIGFSNWPEMDRTSVQAPFPQIPLAGIPCSPLTEIYNPNINLGGNVNDHDLLASGLIDPTYGYIVTTDISNGAAQEITLNYVQYPGGISGITWDNISTQAQASSLYFATLRNHGSCGTSVHCAVKLTQLNLN